MKTDLETTKNNLNMARGEFGTLIAKNHDEIEELRRLGERDYYEFTIDKKNKREKVGDLMVELRGVNPKKNIYTVALYVDDARYEKKNRSVNEPIYFFTHGSRAPMEFTVNQVGKDKIAGYLSVPKAAIPPTRRLPATKKVITAAPAGSGSRLDKKGVPANGDALFFCCYSALFRARILRLRNLLASAGSLSCGSFPCS